MRRNRLGVIGVEYILVRVRKSLIRLAASDPLVAETSKVRPQKKLGAYQLPLSGVTAY